MGGAYRGREITCLDMMNCNLMMSPSGVVLVSQFMQH